MQISSEAFAWLAEHGIVKNKGGKGGAKSAQTLSAHITAGLVSGELFVRLINEALSKHGVKPVLVASKEGDRYETWSQVAKGVRRFAVELDDATIQALADGDTDLTSELLGELCLVYNNWSTNEAKKRKRRQRERRAQPQQGGGYGGRANVSQTPAVSQRSGGPSESLQDDAGGVETPLAEDPAPSPLHDDQADVYSEGVTPQAYLASSPASQQAVEPDYSHVDVAPHSVPSPRQAPRATAAVIESQVAAPLELSEEDAEIALHQRAPEVVAAQQFPEKHTPTAVAGSPSVSIDHLLKRLSPEIALEAASNAPELLGLSMLGGLRISAAQARALLADDARRLSRAFSEVNERNASHLERWLKSLIYYCGALAELLLLYPAHTAPVLGALQHGLRSPAAGVAEAACWALAGICAGLARGRLGSIIATWLVESSALRDLMALLVGPVAGPETREAAAALIFDCWRHDLLLLLAQHLKQVSKGEQEYLSAVHFLTLSFLKRKEAVELCLGQGIFSHFLARCVQRLGDDRSTASTQQAAALLASELWLSSMELKGVHAVAPEGPGDLLAALKRASQSVNWPTLRLVAFSCLSRLLGALCTRRDPENTPAVYRTFVYALVEAEGAGVRDFAVRNLMELMKQHSGVPVGILVEPMMKKFHGNHREALSLIDIELFLVIAKHPRCTARHAEMLAQALAQDCVESVRFGRAASLPLLAILQRFAGDDSIAQFFERFLQIVLTRLIQKGAPKSQTTQILEVLAKIACLQSPRLEQTMRAMLLEISRAYLLSFESLHPNLQALLELWPADEAAIRDWADSQFVAERPPSHQGQAVDNSGNLVLRSVSPSLKSEPPRTPGKQLQNPSNQGREADMQAFRDQFRPEGDMPGAKPSAVELPDSARGYGRTPAEATPSAVAAQALGSESGLGDVSDVDEPAGISPTAASEGAGGDAKVEQFVRETEQLRQELERARERQQKANEEAEGLRRELDEAQRVHKNIENEVKQLQGRREGLLQKRDASARDRGHGRKAADAGTPVADSEKATSLLTAFKEPLQAIFTLTARAKKNRGPARDAIPVQSLEQLFVDLEIVPGRMSKKSLVETLRAARPRARDEPVQFDDFLSLLQRAAVLAFRPREATPFEHIGVLVPIDKDPVAQLQVQAMLQQVGSLAASSAVAAVRTAGPAFDVAVQQWVLKYAQGVLEDLNSRLAKGEELKDDELPEGFEVKLQTPPVRYAVPDELPIPDSEKHCVEILDGILASAVGLHFLEPSSNTSGPVPKVVVRGHEDISSLIVEQPSTLDQEQIRSPDREQQPAARRSSLRTNVSAPVQSSPQPTAAASQVSKQSEEIQPDWAQRARGRRQRHNGRRRRESPREPIRAAAPSPREQEERREPRRRPRESQRRRRSTQQQPRESSTQQAPPQARREQQPRRVAPAPAPAPPPAPPAPPAPTRRPAPSSPRRPVPAPTARQPSASPPPRVAAPAPAPATAPAPEAVASREIPRRINDRNVRQHSSAAQQGKERQEAIQAALQSAEMQSILRSMGPSFHRTFDFFARWKGGNDGSMQVAGFLKLGECFGLLDSKMLKVIFKHVGGQGLVSEVFPEALFLCAVRTVEVELGAAKPSVDEERPLWLKAFRELCQHMNFTDKNELRRILDSYRRTGDTLSAFQAGIQSTAPALAAASGPAEVTASQPGRGEHAAELQATLPPAATSTTPKAAVADPTEMPEVSVSADATSLAPAAEITAAVPTTGSALAADGTSPGGAAAAAEVGEPTAAKTVPVDGLAAEAAPAESARGLETEAEAAAAAKATPAEPSAPEAAAAEVAPASAEAAKEAVGAEVAPAGSPKSPAEAAALDAMPGDAAPAEAVPAEAAPAEAAPVEAAPVEAAPAEAAPAEAAPAEAAPAEAEPAEAAPGEAAPGEAAPAEAAPAEAGAAKPADEAGDALAS